MKYWVDFSCGHTEEIQLFGKVSERNRKIKYYEESGICSTCYREQKEIEKSIGCNEVRMHYKDYKTKYADCKTKSGSYNGSDKTIIVYIPVGRVEENPSYDYEEEEDDYRYTPSATARDYGPGNPWDAPGMSIRDFI